MGSYSLTEHAQNLLEGVKRENPRGKGKLGNEKKITEIKKNKVIKLSDIIFPF